MKQLLLLSVFIFGFISYSWSETVKRKVEPFNKISLRIEANLYYEQADRQKIEIKANEETLEKIITEVKDNKLIIRFKLEDRIFTNWRPGSITIKVSSPEINGFSLAGSGDIIVVDEISTDIMTLNITGSGDLKLADLNCDKLEAVINGSGNILLAGRERAMNTDVTINGSGNFKGKQFKTEYVKIKIAGSGDCVLNVRKHIEAKIVGSGNIKYKGNPSIDATLTGSGSVKELD